MKITKSQLKQIIKEELKSVVLEENNPLAADIRSTSQEIFSMLRDSVIFQTEEFYRLAKLNGWESRLYLEGPTGTSHDAGPKGHVLQFTVILKDAGYEEWLAKRKKQ